MAPLSRGRELLEAAVGYALADLTLVTARLLSRPTPCPGWDLETLLDHVSESLAVLHDAVATAGASVSGAQQDHSGPGHDPVARPRREAGRLLDACAATVSGERRIAIGGHELTLNMVAVTGAIEIAAHGWDISVTCGAHRPIPPGLAAILLPIAPLLLPPGTRPGLFASPVRLTGPARPGDQLVAFLGRQPRPAPARRLGSA